MVGRNEAVMHRTVNRQRKCRRRPSRRRVVLGTMSRLFHFRCYRLHSFPLLSLVARNQAHPPFLLLTPCPLTWRSRVLKVVPQQLCRNWIFIIDGGISTECLAVWRDGNLGGTDKKRHTHTEMR